MKVKILKCSEPGAWYENRVGEEIDIQFVPSSYFDEHRRGKISLILNAKTWNWFWKRTDIQTIPFKDCELTDSSGSAIADGYELGVAHGKVLKEQELVKEGILEDEPDEDDEELTLAL